MILSKCDFFCKNNQGANQMRKKDEKSMRKKKNATISLRPMIPIKVKKKKINLATYAMFDLLSKNALMEAKNLENYLKDL